MPQASWEAVVGKSGYLSWFTPTFQVTKVMGKVISFRLRAGKSSFLPLSFAVSLPPAIVLTRIHESACDETIPSHGQNPYNARLFSKS